LNKKSGKIIKTPRKSGHMCPASSILAGQIPTLEQVLADAKQSGLQVKIKLKGPGTVEPSLEVFERLGMVKQCSVSSFDLECLAYFQELRPDTQDYQMGALFANDPDNYIQQA
jgi:glycerophosphoryl diester phosphodiesterase